MKRLAVLCILLVVTFPVAYWLVCVLFPSNPELASSVQNADDIELPTRSSLSSVETSERIQVQPSAKADSVPEPVAGPAPKIQQSNSNFVDSGVPLHFEGVDVDAGQANLLHRRLMEEPGLKRLIDILEQLLFPESLKEKKCAKLASTSLSDRLSKANEFCISAELLGAKSHLKSVSDAFTPTFVQSLMGDYNRNYATFRPPHSIPSFPLITGDGFKFIADFQCDTKPNQKDNCELDPTKITNRSIVFVNTLDVERFTAKLPHINAHFFIITHNRDHSVPGVEGQTLLNSPKLLKWFGKNIDTAHPKMVPIPIGIENRFYKNGEHPEEYLEVMQSNHNSSSIRDMLIHFTLRKYNPSRAKAMDIARAHGFGVRQTRKFSHKVRNKAFC